jgi:2-polyprenyl-6-methoxyphenol hydroxylase-like FAD-dependent oxidoreductase
LKLNGRVIAILESRSGERSEEAGDGLIGADGIHSRVRSIFYPGEGPPRWSGMMLWRAVVLVSVPEEPKEVSAELLQRLFDLTLAEARLCELLVQGETVAEPAKSLNIVRPRAAISAMCSTRPA